MENKNNDDRQKIPTFVLILYIENSFFSNKALYSMRRRKECNN